MTAILVMAATFALCFGIDRLFTIKFRSKAQHRSGLSVRLSKHYAVFGVLLLVLGIASLVSGVLATPLLVGGGVLVIGMGVFLIGYYMSFGIFYDAKGFILNTFGKKNAEYRYGDILGQRLYVVQGGNMIVELHMQDGTAVQIQSAMEGANQFLDHAFLVWLQQTGQHSRNCEFHDPENYVWFPTVEE